MQGGVGLAMPTAVEAMAGSLVTRAQGGAPSVFPSGLVIRLGRVRTARLSAGGRAHGWEVNP